MQTNIFGEVDILELTIKQASKKAKVSTATIRNWIKIGYLKQTGRGLIDNESFEMFMNEIAGKEKLNARANKSLKDKQDYLEISKKVNQLLEKSTLENISQEYENLLSESYRNKEGIYYTPEWIISDMFKDIELKREYKFLEPCCGSGNFIIEAIKKGIAPENVYGYDTDENAVKITIERIKKEFGYTSKNIKVGNFLDEAHNLSKENIKFDIIFTNPAWGKKIDKSQKERYSAIYGCGNSLDTSALFLGASLVVLSENGYLGFLIQDAVFNISSYEDIRKKLTTKKIIRLIDYGKPFEGLIAKAQAIIVKNTPSSLNDKIECSTEHNTFERSLESFVNNPKHIFNFCTNNEESEVIKRLYSTKHITLKNNAKWGLGIVTGNNNRFCSNQPKEGYIPIYKGSDITKNGLKSPSTYITQDFSRLQQVAPLEMYKAKKKVIYKFISSDLCFHCDNEQRFILNSANFFIPDETKLGISAEQLTLLLNSEIMNWVFKKLFSTHKILRGDIELLPIHTDYFSHYSNFSEEKYLEYLNIVKTKDGTYRVKK
jgi:site-specific DNA-methyltransferase (adenine-specific)